MHIVVTSINRPNNALREIARGAIEGSHQFVVVGDTKSPPDFELEGCRFVDMDAQLRSGFAFAAQCPTRHYARKNIGYLIAIQQKAPLILETDDDNIPRSAFFAPRQRRTTARLLREAGWINVYRYFTDAHIWPRGFPLDAVRHAVPPYASLGEESVDCPIQQGLADENPDVDAIYRLLLPLPQSFSDRGSITLGRGAWCPFNSQNTAWWPSAYPLLYLPAYCSFRMTDIWRSFVAQRIAWENGWHVLFHGPTVWQERNEHNLMRDFADEVPGYLHNERIRKTLEDLHVRPGEDELLPNLVRCYEALIRLEVIGAQEMSLLKAWLVDIERIGGASNA